MESLSFTWHQALVSSDKNWDSFAPRGVCRVCQRKEKLLLRYLTWPVSPQASYRENNSHLRDLRCTQRRFLPSRYQCGRPLHHASWLSCFLCHYCGGNKFYLLDFTRPSPNSTEMPLWGMEDGARCLCTKEWARKKKGGRATLPLMDFRAPSPPGVLWLTVLDLPPPANNTGLKKHASSLKRGSWLFKMQNKEHLDWWKMHCTSFPSPHVLWWLLPPQGYEDTACFICPCKIFSELSGCKILWPV